MFIGGKANIGKDIIEYFNADFYSKSVGYNVDNDTDIEKLANLSLNYDTVIVHVFTEKNSQMRVLHNIVNLWYNSNKEGNIIVTSSIAGRYIFYKSADWTYYSSMKAGLNCYCHMISKGCIDRKYKFSISNILPGTLGNKGIESKQYCKVIDFILQEDTPYIPEITIETKHANI